jgi:hypothetical protein
MERLLKDTGEIERLTLANKRGFRMRALADGTALASPLHLRSLRVVSKDQQFNQL